MDEKEDALRRAAKELCNQIEAKVGHYPFAGEFTRNLFEQAVVEWLKSLGAEIEDAEELDW